MNTLRMNNVFITAPPLTSLNSTLPATDPPNKPPNHEGSHSNNNPDLPFVDRSV